ncbi:cupredoxin domain-containing protein [Candidatus Gottesmanbacteria bacterium]|nr:cupredoxin domain-containing protein [Candidatus Gottesmanbacteria bacterium]
MQKNVLFAVIGLILVVGGAFAVINMGKKEAVAPTTTEETQTVPTEGTNEEKVIEATVGGQITGVMEKEETVSPSVNVKTFTVEGSNFSYSIKEMRVKKGDTVRVTFVVKDGTHDWNLDEFDGSTKVLSAGQSQTTQFVANKAGTYEYYCSVGQHRANGMVGKFIVE